MEKERKKAQTLKDSRVTPFTWFIPDNTAQSPNPISSRETSMTLQPAIISSLGAPAPVSTASGANSSQLPADPSPDTLGSPPSAADLPSGAVKLPPDTASAPPDTANPPESSRTPVSHPSHHPPHSHLSLHRPLLTWLRYKNARSFVQTPCCPVRAHVFVHLSGQHRSLCYYRNAESCPTTP